MKFNLKTILIISLALISAILSNRINSETRNCENPCVACQRTVYQLKFQQLADCGGAQCKNTCYKIKAQWNNDPEKSWIPFVEDIYGKCEICFRNGYCDIQECKAQQEEEFQYIDEVVNKAHLTVKKKNFLKELDFPQFNQDLLFYDPAKLHSLDDQIDASKMKASNFLDTSFIKEDAKDAINEVNSIMKNLFQQDTLFSGKSVDEIKGDKTELSEKSKIDEFVDATDKYVKNSKQLIDLNKGTKGSKDELNKVLKKTQDDVERKLKENKTVLKIAEKKGLSNIKAAVKKAIKTLNTLKKDLKVKA